MQTIASAFFNDINLYSFAEIDQEKHKSLMVQGR